MGNQQKESPSGPKGLSDIKMEWGKKHKTIVRVTLAVLHA